jgi:hypothetical protein
MKKENEAKEKERNLKKKSEKVKKTKRTENLTQLGGGVNNFG